MTTDEFLTALTAFAPTYAWRVEPISGYLRGYVSTPTGVSEEYCPLTALARACAGALWDVTEWEQAAATYALTLEEASDIVGAADNDGSDDNGLLRARLLQAVGL